MKGFDYNIGKEYEIKVMSTTELRQIIMKDNNLTEDDIFNHYLLNNHNDIEVKYKNWKGIESNARLYSFCNTSDLINQYILMQREQLGKYSCNKLVRIKSIKECILDANIPSEELTDLNDINCMEEFVKNNPKYFYFTDELIYESASNYDCIKDTYNYNRELYEKHSTLETDHFNQGIENSPVVININKDGKIELIDGFYRILYKKIDRNVLVKVYNNITDDEWFSLMINFNYWKTQNDLEMFFDRGFLIGLRFRFNIKLEDYVYSELGRMSNLSLIKILKHITKNVYYDLSRKYDSVFSDDDKIKGKVNYMDYLTKNKVLNNKYFISDLKMFKNYINYDVECIKNNKKLKDINIFKTSGYEVFIKVLLRIIVHMRVLYSEYNMNELPEDLIDILLKNKDIANSFTKSLTMSTVGHIENRYLELIPILVKELKSIMLKE